jgi:HAD superfamily hydrolase (TIGR01549 family)
MKYFLLLLLCCISANAKIVKPDVIFFDFDGTISDNTQQLGFAFKMAIKKHGFGDNDLIKIIEYELKGDFYTPWEMAEKQLTKTEFIAMEKDYHKYYFDLVKTEMYSEVEGVRNFLEFCKKEKIPMIILSGRDGNAVRKETEYRDWNKYFAGIYGERDFGNFVKPQIESLQMAAQKSNIKYKTCWYIGDTNTDIQMAINADCDAFYVGNPNLINKKYDKLHITNYKDLLSEFLL